MFLAGFATAALIAFLFFVFIAIGIHVCVKDNEMAFAVYSEKDGKWKITKNFGVIAGAVEFRLKFRPDTVKILGED